MTREEFERTVDAVTDLNRFIGMGSRLDRTAVRQGLLHLCPDAEAEEAWGA